MIAVSVSRVQSIGNELAVAEDRAERQLSEKVATIAEDIIGELLQSRMKLTEMEQEFELLPMELEETEVDRARLKRSISISGPMTVSEMRQLEATRPFLLRRRNLRQATSKLTDPAPAPAPSRRTTRFELGTRTSTIDAPFRKSSVHDRRSTTVDVSNRKMSEARHKYGVSISEDNEGNSELLPHDTPKTSHESLQKLRNRKFSEAFDRRSSTCPTVEETRLSEEPHGVVVITADDSAEGREKAQKEAEVKKKKSVLVKHVKAAAWSSLGMITYCLLGGLFVSLIESSHEAEGRIYKDEQHDMFINALLEELGINSTSSNDSAAVTELVHTFENEMINALKSTVPDGEPTWTFVRSWFFSWTVVTAIGYGNYTPVTQLGRVWVMVFGMLGIPLVVLNSMRFGSLFTQLTIYARRKLIRFFCKCMKKDKKSAKEDENLTIEEYMPPWVAITLLPAYCAIMAAVFCTWEPWNYFDSFYFTFVTLAGIGLGDIAPSREEVMMLFTVFMMIGLGLFAMFMEMGAMQFIRLGKHIKSSCKPYAKHSPQSVQSSRSSSTASDSSAST